MADPYPAIAKRYEPRIRAALAEAWKELKLFYPLGTLERALTTEGAAGMLRLIEELPFEDTLSSNLFPELQAAILESGRVVGEILPAGATTGPLSFTLVNPQTAEAVRRYSLTLIRGISAYSREAIRNAVQASVVTGVGPRTTARDFRETIGLTPQLEQASRNYRRSLETADSTALNLELRDKRFDTSVRRAVEDGEPLGQARINQLVTRYREKALRHRTEVISRTETLRAISLGEDEGLLQAQEAGQLDPNLRSFWVYTEDARTRAAHREIPGLNPEGVPIGGTFTTPLGPLRYPRDPAGSAENTTLCRCRRRYRLVQ